MAEVEETREFEQLAAMAIVPSESPPPPYIERSPPGNEETVRSTDSECTWKCSYTPGPV